MAVLWNLLAIFSITFVVANVSLSAIFALVSQQLLNIQVRSRKALLWLVVLLPWLISFFLSIYLVQSYHIESVFNGFSFPHWHHMNQFEWYSWHGVTVGSACGLTLYFLFKHVNALRVHRKEVEALMQFSTQVEDDVYHVESSEASAFTSGFITKRCFVTTGLLAQTTPEEYEVVIAHEKAHVAKHDPFNKWLFSFFSAFFIKPISVQLKLHMTLAMEQAADDAVIKSGFSKIFVASTLVKIAKLNAQSHLLKHNELTVNFGADVLEQRIYFLLDKLKLAPLHKGITIILILLLVAISTTSIDGIHHFMETLFSH